MVASCSMTVIFTQVKFIQSNKSNKTFAIKSVSSKPESESVLYKLCITKSDLFNHIQFFYFNFASKTFSYEGI